MRSSQPIDISVIIINYNVKHFAEQCLRSIYSSRGDFHTEIILVDNASIDGSIEYLRSRYPDVKYIANNENLGFGRANNQALKQASGRYVLILNPDTLLGENSLRSMIGYMDSHTGVGAMGPMILTREGRFDIASKRGLPTPWVAFCRLSGLTRLFPKSKLFGRYNLLYLPEDRHAEVDALAGSCMVVRKEAYDVVGGFDEDFFMYGEDVDWCYRIKLAGWKVCYAPVTKIVHFKGESTRRSSIDRDRAFYGAMHLFVEKHFKGRYPRFTHWAIDFGIILARTAAQMRAFRIQMILPLFDWAAIWSILVFGRWIRWGDTGLNFSTSLAITLQTTAWVLCLAGLGAYGKRRGQVAPLILGMSLGFFLNSSFTYFFPQFAYSRFLNLFGFVIGGGVVWGWRAGLAKLSTLNLSRRLYSRKTLIVGIGDTARDLLRRLTQELGLYHPVGFVDPGQESIGSVIDGLPVLGDESELGRLLQLEEIEEVLFAYDKMDYNRVLETISQTGRRKGVNFKVITPEVTAQTDGLPPLLAVEYFAPRGWKSSLQRVTTIILGR